MAYTSFHYDNADNRMISYTCDYNECQIPFGLKIIILLQIKAMCCVQTIGQHHISSNGMSHLLWLTQHNYNNDNTIN